MSHEHPQIKAFQEAAAAMKEQRYWSYSGPEEQGEFLEALSDVLREVCYHLDKHQVLPSAAMQAYRDAAEIKIPTSFPTSAELILTTLLESHIQECRAAAPTATAPVNTPTEFNP